MRVFVLIAVAAGLCSCAPGSTQNDVSSTEAIGELYQDTTAAANNGTSAQERRSDAESRNYQQWLYLKDNQTDTLPYFRFVHCTTQYPDQTVFYPGDRCVMYYESASETGYDDCTEDQSLYKSDDLKICSTDDHYLFLVKTQKVWKLFPYISPGYHNRAEALLDSVWRRDLNGKGTEEIVFYWSYGSQGMGGSFYKKGITIIDPDSETLLFEDIYDSYSGGWSDSVFVTEECTKDIQFDTNWLAIAIKTCNTDERLQDGMVDEYVIRNGVFVRNR